MSELSVKASLICAAYDNLLFSLKELVTCSSDTRSETMLERALLDSEYFPFDKPTKAEKAVCRVLLQAAKLEVNDSRIVSNYEKQLQVYDEVAKNIIILLMEFAELHKNYQADNIFNIIGEVATVMKNRMFVQDTIYILSTQASYKAIQEKQNSEEVLLAKYS